MKGISSNTLKILAAVSMVIDHITFCFIPKLTVTGDENLIWYLGRGIGRSAFIIFAFLLVEGYFYTENFKKYLLRMFIAAVISEVPFDLMCGTLDGWLILTSQNVMFTFVIGLLLIEALEFLRKTYLEKSVLKYNIFAGITCALGFVAAFYLRVDYGMVGIGLILIFYFFRNRGWRLSVAVVIWAIVCLFLEHQLEWAGLIALVPIMKFYNGSKGRGLKWFFYIFYPVHMLLLGLICMAVYK
ncbi:MAG: conjugal transfer protein TraX [Lachnospiraceae bacterium]|nr:conjugal transfer protein TraX [Lachnospiraceae bacterium]